MRHVAKFDVRWVTPGFALRLTAHSRVMWVVQQEMFEILATIVDMELLQIQMEEM